LSHPEIPTVKAGYQIYQIESADLGRSERPIATNKPHLGHPPGAIASLNLWYLQGLNILKQLSNLQPWQFKGLLCKTDVKSLALQSAIVESQKIAGESASNAGLKSKVSVLVIVRAENCATHCERDQRYAIRRVAVVRSAGIIVITACTIDNSSLCARSGHVAAERGVRASAAPSPTRGVLSVDPPVASRRPPPRRSRLLAADRRRYSKTGKGWFEHLEQSKPTRTEVS
jgi:hypothetical protein